MSKIKLTNPKESNNPKDEPFRKGMYHLKMAKDYFSDIIRDAPNTVAAKFSRRYFPKLGWIFLYLKTDPEFESNIMQDFFDDINGDIMFHEAISSKCLILTDEQKVIFENLLDAVIAGETIKFIHEETIAALPDPVDKCLCTGFNELPCVNCRNK